MRQNLCKATAHWLAYKKAAGFEHALSEALLIVPVAECLAAYGYVPKTEIDTTRYDVGTPGLFNYDVIAEKDDGTTIFLETKYLRAKHDVKRCLIDVLKLALPTDVGPQRILLVAGDAATVGQFSLKSEYSLNALEGEAELHAAFAKFLKKFKAEKSKPELVTVEDSEPIEANGEAVKAFSIGRK